jgi:hypothetical protein
VETFAAFVTVGPRAFAAGQELGLSCAAVEAVIEAGLIAEADVGQAHTAVLAVVFGTTEGARSHRREGRAAIEAMFGSWIDGLMDCWIFG